MEARGVGIRPARWVPKVAMLDDFVIDLRQCLSAQLLHGVTQRWVVAS